MGKHKDKRVEMISCACGCGETLNKYDGEYRTRTIINGHNNRKYDDPTEYKRVYTRRTRKLRRQERGQVKRARRKRYKDLILKRRGLKCVNCGVKYDGENAPMFDLHHVSQKDKLFEVNGKSVQNYAVEKVLIEADKCVILCSNCHRLHHHTNLVKIDKDILNEN